MDGHTLNQLEAFDNLGIDLNNISDMPESSFDEQKEMPVVIQLATEAEVAEAAGVLVSAADLIRAGRGEDDPEEMNRIEAEVERITTSLMSEPQRLLAWWDAFAERVGTPQAIRATTHSQRLRVQQARDAVEYERRRRRGREVTQQQRGQRGQRERSLSVERVSPPRTPPTTRRADDSEPPAAPQRPQRQPPRRASGRPDANAESHRMRFIDAGLVSLERPFNLETMVEPYAVSLAGLPIGLPEGAEEHRAGWLGLQAITRLAAHYMLMVTLHVEAHICIEEASRIVRYYNDRRIIHLFRWLVNRQDARSIQLCELHTFLKAFFVDAAVEMNRQFVTNRPLNRLRRSI